MSDLQLLCPTTLAEALANLAEHTNARCIAGGATLVAMMNADLVEPTVLVSLDCIPELKGITRENSKVRIGAMTRHNETAASPLFHDGQRIVPLAAARIANLPVRNMGTIGGSLAFADPAADYLTALTAAEAVVECTSSRGQRQISVESFVTDWYTTVLAEDEMVTGVIVPPAMPHSVAHYEKLARVSGDFAIVSVAVVMAAERRTCRSVRIAVGGCGPAPLRRPDAERMLEGTDLDPDSVARAGAMYVEISSPVDDVRASSEYRRIAVPRLLAKALQAAMEASIQ